MIIYFFGRNSSAFKTNKGIKDADGTISFIEKIINFSPLNLSSKIAEPRTNCNKRRICFFYILRHPIFTKKKVECLDHCGSAIFGRFFDTSFFIRITLWYKYLLVIFIDVVTKSSGLLPFCFT